MSDTFVTVPRPKDKTATSKGQHHQQSYQMSRWLSESVEEQPYNTIAAIKHRPTIENNKNQNSESISETLAKDDRLSDPALLSFHAPSIPHK
ncbi:hypothetical protein FG05_35330 [Fusarium graminearum]|nr:hypothetical protein FG05_35330 [Fusarium graminearum]